MDDFVQLHLLQLTAELQVKVSYKNNTYRTLNGSIFYSYEIGVTVGTNL